MPTLKEELDSANSQLAALQGKVTAFEASEKQLKADVEAALKNLTAEQEAHGKTKTDLTAAQTALASEQTAHKAVSDELASIKADKTTAEKRVSEKLAAAGIETPGKQTPAALAADAAADAALWEKYTKATSVEQAQMRRELGAKLDAAAVAYDAEHAAQ